MSETAKTGLPLLQASQAQKHVTMNEALARIDALLQLTLASRGVAHPPEAATDGSVYAVPAGAVNAWEGQEGRLALRLNGGWVFLAPRAGWRAWVADEARAVHYTGETWAETPAAASAGGAATRFEVAEFDHEVIAGGAHEAGTVIPWGTQVIGVTARILEPLTGSLSGWRLGVAGSDNRYGSGLSLAAGSWVRGLTGTPVSYYSDTPVLLTPEGGAFAGGRLRMAIHLVRLDVPALG